MATWNVGGGYPHWHVCCPIDTPIWEAFKANITLLLNHAGLVRLQGTGPSDRGTPQQHVRDQICNAIASSDAATTAGYVWLPGQAIIWNRHVWDVKWSAIRKVFPTYEENQKARRHWRRWIQFEAVWKPNQPAQTRFLMGMPHTFSGRYGKGTLEDHTRTKEASWEAFKREAVHSTLHQLEADAGDRTVLLFGDSNIEGHVEIEACLDTYGGFARGYSFLGTSKDLVVVAYPGQLEEAPWPLCPWRPWHKDRKPIVTSISLRKQRPAPPWPPLHMILGRGGDHSDHQEAATGADEVLQEAKTLWAKTLWAKTEVEEAGKEKEAGEEQDRHVHPYPPRASNCNCN